MTNWRSVVSVRQSVVAAALALGSGPVVADIEKPQYGGTLEVGTVFVTLSVLTWDATDWNWKFNHDSGPMYEQLFVADLDKSRHKGGGTASTPMDGCLPMRSVASWPRVGR